MNKGIKIYFDNHLKADVLYFTTDGQCFFTKAGAAAHAPNLEKKEKGTGTILEVTRQEVKEWWASEAPKLAAAAEKRVIACEKEVETAQAAVTALPKATTPTKRAQANKSLKDAITAHETATAELEIAIAEAAKVAPTETIVTEEKAAETEAEVA